MKTLFNDSALSTSSKHSFELGTLFHDGETWKVQPFDASQNGASSDSSTDPSPVVRVQRVVNGTAVGAIERIFISSLIRDDAPIEGPTIPHTGKVNTLATQQWNRADLTSDASATKAVVDAIFVAHPDGIITCKRQLAKDASGKVLQKMTFTGNLRPLVTINWD